jgi:23S rRNA (adenine2503-C2)-methyltransferase
MLEKGLIIFAGMEEVQKKDLRKLSPGELNDFFKSIGEKAFRSKQVSEWLWKKSATTIDEMSNLSTETRNKIKETFAINPVQVDHMQNSMDGTIKSAFRLYDGHLVEGVLIPTEKRITACISSQVGCSLTCRFCATGFLERKRNLDASEIYDQVVLLNQQALDHYSKPLTNIVYMGMGEPMLNYAEVLKSVEYITSPNGLNMSYQRITVSTAGVAKMIRKLADDNAKFNLALSLHAADDEKRSQIMPINETNTLEAIKEALEYYYDKSGKPVTFEYILFYHFNDSLKDADNLFKFTKHVPSKVNIIEYNPISEADFRNTDANTLDKFQDFLTKKGVNVRVRRSRGKDIDAACGQLANKN